MAVKLALCALALCIAVATAMPLRHHDAAAFASHAAKTHRFRDVFPKTVSALNVSSYVGKWYQVMYNELLNTTFEKDVYCATAQYGINASDPSRVTVVNRENRGAATGAFVAVEGYAYQDHPTTAPGQLSVVLHGDNAPPFPAPYWILKLGAVNAAGEYTYSIVSDYLRLTLFVLARDVAAFRANDKTEVLAWLAANGFNEFWNKPLEVPQAGCTYRWTQ